MPSLTLGLNVGNADFVQGGAATPSNSYVAPDGTSFYVQPDGASYYLQPE